MPQLNPPLFFLLSGLALTACVSNPITGRQQAMVVSDEQAAAESSQSYTQLIGEASKSQTLDDDPAQLARIKACLLYTSPSPRDRTRSRMPSSA